MRIVPKSSNVLADAQKYQNVNNKILRIHVHERDISMLIQDQKKLIKTIINE